MAWTYSGNPAASARDKVRFLCGDTDTNDQLLQDEEIDYLLTVRSSPESTAPLACSTIMGKLAREVDYTIGPEKVMASQRLKAYESLIKMLRSMWIGAVAAPSFQDPLAEGADPIFDIGMHDEKGNGSGLDG